MMIRKLLMMAWVVLLLPMMANSQAWHVQPTMTYKSALGFSEGMSRVKNQAGKIGFINRNNFV